ncbi:MAG: ECF transporter S component [Candidatus Bathyarchaeota archaeon]|nr:ECF transporter S component [Candidatus Bathyarchaeota archaeon]
MSYQTKRIAIATLFGAIIFITKALLPSPINKMLIGIHALMLALGTLLLKKQGATFVSLIGGVLTALWNVAFAPFTLFFALLYGLLVDAFFLLFRIDVAHGEVKATKVVTAMTMSTSLVGFASYYVTVHLPSTRALMALIPRSLPLEVLILVMGTISGAVAGYFASLIWNSHLKNLRL